VQRAKFLGHGGGDVGDRDGVLQPGASSGSQCAPDGRSRAGAVEDLAAESGCPLGRLGCGDRRPTLRLRVADGRLGAKICFWLERMERVGLRLFKGNAVGPPTDMPA